MANNEENTTNQFEDSDSNEYDEQSSQRFLEIQTTYYRDLEEILAWQKENLKINLSINRDLKRYFFFVCSIIMLAECILQFIVVVKIMFCDFEIGSLDIVLSGVASMTGTFLTTFIVLPKIIAKYLFNTKEQSDIHETMKHLRKSLGEKVR